MVSASACVGLMDRYIAFSIGLLLSCTGAVVVCVGERRKGTRSGEWRERESKKNTEKMGKLTEEIAATQVVRVRWLMFDSDRALLYRMLQ